MRIAEVTTPTRLWLRLVGVAAAVAAITLGVWLYYTPRHPDTELNSAQAVGQDPRSAQYANDMIGRAGNNVGRRVRGKNVFSIRPAKSNRPPTAAQLVPRQKMTLMSGFLSWITPVLEVGFQDYTTQMSTYNAAISYNLKHGVTGVSPNFNINYAEVMLSRGKLYEPDNAEASTAAGAVIEFSWASVVNIPYANANDQLSIVVFNPAKWKFTVKMNAATRAAMAYELHLPLDWSGDEVQVWLFATNAEGKAVSNSLYLGEFTIL